MAAERNELLRSAFIAKIGNGYVSEQFVFLNERFLVDVRVQELDLR